MSFNKQSISIPYPQLFPKCLFRKTLHPGSNTAFGYASLASFNLEQSTCLFFFFSFLNNTEFLKSLGEL